MGSDAPASLRTRRGTIPRPTEGCLRTTRDLEPSSRARRKRRTARSGSESLVAGDVSGGRSDHRPPRSLSSRTYRGTGFLEPLEPNGPRDVREALRGGGVSITEPTRAYARRPGTSGFAFDVKAATNSGRYSSRPGPPGKPPAPR